MKIIFAGTPNFATNALEALLNEHQVLAVLTQPDRPSGRGMHLTASPVKLMAQKNGITLLQPSTLKIEEVQNELVALNADVMVVAAYGLILPQAVLKIPIYGCLNVHASLLPRWRGAAPIQRAILAGDTETGITIMQMDEGLDTGEMLMKRHCAIRTDDTAQTLHDKLADMGAQAIIETLHQLEQNQLQREQQDARLATYAAKLNKNEAQLDWSGNAIQLERAVRGYFPFPTATTQIRGTNIKILQAKIHERNQEPISPGTVIRIEKECIMVACGQGALGLEVLQKPGGKALPAAQFIQAFQIKAGDRFGAD